MTHVKHHYGLEYQLFMVPWHASLLEFQEEVRTIRAQFFFEMRPLFSD
jgi:hypothetical protein